MKFARPLVIAASALALLVSACSQPEDVATPALAPQFGTAFEDRADTVAYDPKRAYSYVAGVDTINRKLPNDFIESGGVVFLRRYTKTGGLVWQWREAVESGVDPFVNATLVNDAGNTYLGWLLYSTDGYLGATVLKFSPAGKVLYRLSIDNGIFDLEGDAAGNIYLSGLTAHDEEVEKYFLRKYDPQGKLVWERLRTFDDFGGAKDGSIAQPSDVGIAEDGSLYVAGHGEGDFVLTKYGRAGRTLWQRTVPGSSVVGGGPNFNADLVSVGSGGVYLVVNTDDQY